MPETISLKSTTLFRVSWNWLRYVCLGVLLLLPLDDSPDGSLAFNLIGSAVTWYEKWALKMCT
jgi:hypothetical protein